jgi:cell division protein FtsL
MTILQPHKNRAVVNFLVILFVILLTGGVFYIFEYNSFVNTRYQLSALKKSVVELQASNADLKSDFYKVTDPAQFEKMAADRGLILERKPDYLKQDQWLSDSSR